MGVNKNNIFLKATCLAVILLLSFTLLIGCTNNQSDSNSENSTKEFQFLYFSDTQADPEAGSYEEWGRLFHQGLQSGNPEFALLGGDLVNDGRDKEEWAKFSRETGHAIPLYPAAGNHDAAASKKELFQLPENGPVEFVETIYSFNYENAHFVVLDSNAMGNPDLADRLGKWLKSDLENAVNADWKIVMFHHPMYPALDIPKDQARAETMQQYYLPILEEAGVDLILCGHQHSYTRTYPMKKGEISTREEGGIVQLMCVSGPKYYTVSNHNYIEIYQENRSVYAMFTINRNLLSLIVKDAEGNTVDGVYWEKIH